MRRTGALAALGVLLAVTLAAACAGERVEQTSPAAVSNHQVQAIAEHMLAAYNLGDDQAVSRDLSLPAKTIVDAEALAEYRIENLSVTGPFMAVTRVELKPGKQDPAHVRYVVRTQFQYLNVDVLVLTLSRDGRVEGLELYPRPEW